MHPPHRSSPPHRPCVSGSVTGQTVLAHAGLSSPLLCTPCLWALARVNPSALSTPTTPPCPSRSPHTSTTSTIAPTLCQRLSDWPGTCRARPPRSSPLLCTLCLWAPARVNPSALPCSTPQQHPHTHPPHRSSPPQRSFVSGSVTWPCTCRARRRSRPLLCTSCLWAPARVTPVPCPPQQRPHAPAGPHTHPPPPPSHRPCVSGSVIGQAHAGLSRPLLCTQCLWAPARVNPSALSTPTTTSPLPPPVPTHIHHHRRHRDALVSVAQ